MARVWRGIVAVLPLLAAGTGSASAAAQPTVLVQRGGGFVALAADGTQRVVIDGESVDRPTVSPDGRRFVYPSTGPVASAMVLVDGAKVTRHAVHGEPGVGLWSPDSRRIAYTDGTHVMVWDTRADVTVDVGPGSLLGASWASTSRALVYVDPDGGRIYSYVVGGTRRALGTVASAPGDAAAAFSPSGKLIAMVERTASGDRAAIVRLDGSHRVVLGQRGLSEPSLGVGPDGAPWSPDSRYVEITFGGSIAGALVIFNTRGHGRRVRIDTCNSSCVGAWSSRGDRLLVAVPGGRSAGSWLVTPRTARRIDRRPAYSVDWAPNGRTAVFGGLNASIILRPGGGLVHLHAKAGWWAPDSRHLTAITSAGVGVVSAAGRWIRRPVAGLGYTLAWSPRSTSFLAGSPGSSAVTIVPLRGPSRTLPIEAGDGLAFASGGGVLVVDERGVIVTVGTGGRGRHEWNRTHPWLPVDSSSSTSLSPDRQRVLWTSPGGLYAGRIDGVGDPVRIGTQHGLDPEARWSSDSARVALTATSPLSVEATVFDATTGERLGTTQWAGFLDPAMRRTFAVDVTTGAQSLGLVGAAPTALGIVDPHGVALQVDWSPDGSALAVVESDPPGTASPANDVWTIDIATRTPVAVATGLVGVVKTSWSPDGTRLAVAQVDTDHGTARGLIADPRSPGSGISFTPPLTSSAPTDPQLQLSWSPDGRRIGFKVSFDGRAATTTAVLATADGSTLAATDPARVPLYSSPDIPWDWAADGETALLRARQGGVLLDSGGHVAAVDAIPGGAWIDNAHYVYNASSALEMLDTGTPTTSTVILPNSYASVVLGPTTAGSGLVVLQGDQQNELSLVNIDTAVLTALTDPSGPFPTVIGWMP